VREFYYNPNTKMINGFPKIKKLGAVSPYGESTPFVFNGKLLRLELRDDSRGTNTSYPKDAIIRDRETGEIISTLAENCYYHSFYQEDGVAYVLATKSSEKELCGSTIMIFESRDLRTWTSRELISREGYRFCNTSLTKGPDGYILLLEYFDDSPLSYIFATSPDMINWTFMSDDHIYAKNRYVGGPWMKYSRGWYYVISVEQLPGMRYTNYLHRTKDFLHWECGFYNPILMPDEDDRKISPYAYDLTQERINEIRTGFISSNSDIDMCDYNGKTLITYNIGNQLGFYYLAEAEYDGSVADFLEANFY